MLDVIENLEIVEINTAQRREYEKWFCHRCGFKSCTSSCMFLRRFVEIEEETEKRVRESVSDSSVYTMTTFNERKKYRKARESMGMEEDGRSMGPVFVWNQ